MDFQLLQWTVLKHKIYTFLYCSLFSLLLFLIMPSLSFIALIMIGNYMFLSASVFVSAPPTCQFHEGVGPTLYIRHLSKLLLNLNMSDWINASCQIWIKPPVLPSRSHPYLKGWSSHCPMATYPIFERNAIIPTFSVQEGGKVCKLKEA